MLIKLIQLMIRRPDLAAHHLCAYATLVQGELESARHRWLIALVGYAVCFWVLTMAAVATLFSLTLGLAGLAGWSLKLFVPPLALAVLALASWGFARLQGRHTAPLMHKLSVQLKKDVAWFKHLEGNQRAPAS